MIFVCYRRLTTTKATTKQVNIPYSLQQTTIKNLKNQTLLIQWPKYPNAVENTIKHARPNIVIRKTRRNVSIVERRPYNNQMSFKKPQSRSKLMKYV